MGWTCPNATEVDLVTAAIQQGVITWHAMPFNPQYEVRRCHSSHHSQYTRWARSIAQAAAALPWCNRQARHQQSARLFCRLGCAWRAVPVHPRWCVQPACRRTGAPQHKQRLPVVLVPLSPVQVFDSSLLRFAVGLTHSLDERFGLPRKRMASLVSLVATEGGWDGGNHHECVRCLGAGEGPWLMGEVSSNPHLPCRPAGVTEPICVVVKIVMQHHV